jgi:hypothetical protein
MESFDIPVKPVFEGKEYDSAYNEFSKSFEVYQNIFNLEKAKLDDAVIKIKQYDDRNKKINASSNQVASNSLITINKTSKKTLNETEFVKRVFTANKFGIWNCDSPYPYNKKDKVAILARNAVGAVIEEGRMYVCDLNLKAIFSYNELEREKVGMEKGNNYMIWIVDADERLHFANLSFENSELPESKKVTLEMNTLSKIPDNPKQLQKILGI